ncbi:MAG: serine hydrolase domain-containing protein, partial [Clostridia bacterium]
MQTLAQSLHYFTEEARILSCLSVSYGDAHHAVSMRSGRMREQIPVLPASADLPVTTDTLYDLASLTKLFTGIALMQLWDAGRLRLDAPVTSYAPCFSRLGTVSVADILGFQVMLQTPARVDAQPDREAALQTLFQVEARPLVGERVYSDMH